MPGQPASAHQAFPTLLKNLEQRIEQLEVWSRLLASELADWKMPGLEHGWKAVFGGPVYMKDALGFVHVEGFIEGGEADKSAFTLPTGYLCERGGYWTGVDVGGNKIWLAAIAGTGEITPVETHGFAISLAPVIYMAEG